MKAEELIKNNSLQNRVVPEEIAITAVNLAHKEEQELAYNALESVLERWVHGGDAECILEEFKEKLDHGRTL